MPPTGVAVVVATVSPGATLKLHQRYPEFGSRYKKQPYLLVPPKDNAVTQPGVEMVKPVGTPNIP